MEDFGLLPAPPPAQTRTLVITQVEVDCSNRLACLQGTQQGGTLIFQGTMCEWAWYDEATAAHAPPEEIVKRALAT